MNRATAPRVIAEGQAPDSATWRRILERDATLDGLCFYAVVTTGIYCRPSCPARRPDPENVVIYTEQASAAADGFRACRRCRPEGAPVEAEAAFVRQVVSYLEAQSGRPITLKDLGDHVGMDTSTLRRRFQRITGTTPHAYLEMLRVSAIRHRLKDGATVRNATYDSGFGSTRRTYTRVRRRLGMTPAKYRGGAIGVTMRHEFADCTLGTVLVAYTDEGLAFVQVGDDRHAMLATLHDEFAHARHEEAPVASSLALHEVLDRLMGRESSLALPIDIRVTAFQARVYEALLDIPAGETRTYQEVACSIGSPDAARAVGTACASNPVAGVIPCHRVVRSDGGLGGYRWGVERKRRLLRSERLGSETRPRHRNDRRR